MTITLDDNIAFWLRTKEDKSRFINSVMKSRLGIEQGKYNNIEEIETGILILKNKKQEMIEDFNKDIDSLEVYKGEWYKNEKAKGEAGTEPT